MKRLLTAVVLIPIVLLLTFKAPLWLFCGVVCVVAMLAMREYMQLVIAYGYEPLEIATYFLTPLYFALLAALHGFISDPASGAAYLLLAPALVLPVAFMYGVLGMRKNLKVALPSVGLTWIGFVLIVFALGTLVLIRVLPLGPFYLLYIFIVVWSGDAFAYWVGKSIGRHKLAPQISPQKTWEGAIASLAFGGGFGALLLHNSDHLIGWLQQHGAGMTLGLPGRAAVLELLTGSHTWHGELGVPSLWEAFLCSVLINVAAQFGDLVESMMKRGAGVKDSGAILPGHGGMLDRVDALLFAAPVGFVIILFAIHS